RIDGFFASTNMVAFFNLAGDGTRVLFSLFQTSQQTRVI
ncbi:MAG: hypothetical protein RL755_2156, partial [Pseudomonadota bacterium]